MKRGELKSEPGLVGCEAGTYNLAKAAKYLKNDYSFFLLFLTCDHSISSEIQINTHHKLPLVLFWEL